MAQWENVDYVSGRKVKRHFSIFMEKREESGTGFRKNTLALCIRTELSLFGLEIVTSLSYSADILLLLHPITK